jgi:hypothetical protein
VPDSADKHEQEEGLPAEGLRLIRLFLSVERKADRDQIFQMVEKFVAELKQRR